MHPVLLVILAIFISWILAWAMGIGPDDPTNPEDYFR